MQDKYDTDYQWIAEILQNNNKARKDNRVLLKEFYWRYFGLTLDEAFESNDIPNYQSVERKARQLKSKNPNLKYDKTKEVDKYKEIGLDIPIAVRII